VVASARTSQWRNGSISSDNEKRNDVADNNVRAICLANGVAIMAMATDENNGRQKLDEEKRKKTWA